MIPIRLTLKNFMSYGDDGQTLSFENIHVACLSGENGNGKSALLDAMTWALWGKTRASTVMAVTEDDLIRRSADEMEVRFEFELDQTRYRVVKKRRRGKPGDWQFAQAGADGQYMPISGGGTREVGRQIAQLLSMEYDTFLASAYLQQGHADEFTRQKPAQRKQILAEILGLGQYDRLEAMARDRARERKAQLDELDGEIRILGAQADRRAEAETELAGARRTVGDLEQRRVAQETEVAALRAKRVRLDQTAEQRAQMDISVRALSEERRSAEHSRDSQHSKLRDLNDLIAQREAIERDYQALVDGKKSRERLEPQIDEINRKRSELQKVSADIEVERVRLQGEVKTLEQRESVALRQAAELERLDRQAAELRQELAAEQRTLAELAEYEGALESHRSDFERLKSRNRELQDALKELQEVLDLLERPRAACPVCETDLTGVTRERVVARQTEKWSGLKSEQAKVQQEGAASKRTVEESAAKVKALQAEKDRLTGLRSRLEELGRSRTGLACAPEELAKVRVDLGPVREALAGETFLPGPRVQQNLLTRDLDRLAGVQAEYEALSNRVRALAEAENRHRRLSEAAAGLPVEREEMERREQLVASKQKALTQLETEKQALDVQLAELAKVRQDADSAERALAALDTELTERRRHEGAVMRFIEDCERAAVQLQSKSVDRKRVHQEHWTYDKLAGCFGKKGIQALIIENVIPELEEEANELLARMTDNNMQVHFLTTRAGKGGRAEIETLDISITDDAGPRPYELFSGGEAFRANFAIRIALSRLLARRSGARLQTLILDEGFGTQDGKGREKLVEAIEAIKTDFQKILVITHVDELKDSFQQRIEVTKDGEGSKIYVC